MMVGRDGVGVGGGRSSIIWARNNTPTNVKTGGDRGIIREDDGNEDRAGRNEVEGWDCAQQWVETHIGNTVGGRAHG